MNVELEEVVVQDVPDEALELAAGSTQLGQSCTGSGRSPGSCCCGL